MRKLWTLFWRKSIPQITIATGICSMLLSQFIAIFGPLEWKDAAQNAYCVNPSTLLAWTFSFWPPLTLSTVTGILLMARAIAREMDDWRPL